MEVEKIPFGMKDEKMYGIDEVKNGLACDCICPSCKSKLIACNNGKKYEHYFKHYTKTDCRNAGQTAIHLMAKQIIQEEKKIKIPYQEWKILKADEEEDDYYELEYDEDDEIYSNEFFHLVTKESYKEIVFDEVILEKKINNFIPDIICIKKTNNVEKKLLVEIKYSHAIDDEKFEKIKDSDLSCIEIDVSDLDIFITKKELKKKLLEDDRIKEISNPFLDSVYEKYEEEFKQLTNRKKEEKEREEKEREERKKKNLDNYKRFLESYQKQIKENGYILKITDAQTVFCPAVKNFIVIRELCTKNKQCPYFVIDDNDKMRCGYQNRPKDFHKNHFEWYKEEAIRQAKINYARLMKLEIKKENEK